MNLRPITPAPGSLDWIKAKATPCRHPSKAKSGLPGTPGLRLATVLLLFWPVCAAVTPPRWESNLEKRYALESFNRAIDATWTKQQGVIFLTPEKLLLYQVNRNRERPELRSRGPSGGAGNFLLNIKVLSAQDGRVLNSMDITTSGEVSRVLASREGGFVVQAGTALNAYGPTLQQVASINLPLERTAPREGWQMQVSPSGEKLALVHEQVFSSPELLADNSIIHDGRAKVDVQILNSTTLQPEATFTLAHTLPFWALGEEFLLSSNPEHSYSDGRMGRLDFNGSWSALRSDLPKEQHFCRPAMSAIDERRVAFFGCEAFSVFSSRGEALFSRTRSGCVFVSAVAAGRYLALQCDRYQVEQMTAKSLIVSATHPDRIEVYDLESRDRRFSVSVRGERAYYAVSAQGDLAVVDGSNLRVFHATEPR